MGAPAAHVPYRALKIVHKVAAADKLDEPLAVLWINLFNLAQLTGRCAVRALTGGASIAINIVFNILETIVPKLPEFFVSPRMIIGEALLRYLRKAKPIIIDRFINDRGRSTLPPCF
jgi:hypothetical protein